MYLVFNEVSLLDAPTDLNIAKDNFETFIKTYSYAMKSNIGFVRTLHTSEDLNSLAISGNYYAQQWRNDNKTDMDLRRAFKRMCDLQSITKSQSNDTEIVCSGYKGEGFLYAYENDYTLISVGNNMWNKYNLDCICVSLCDDDVQLTLRNLYDEKSIKDNYEDLLKQKNMVFNRCNNRDDFLSNLSIWFPNLIFHKVAISQIKTQVENQHFPIILNKLSKLENYFSSWDGKKFDESKFPPGEVTPESNETLKKFEKQHTFDYDGRKLLVSYHMRYTGNIAGRIYFYPDNGSCKGIICSLTTKLPTVSYPKEKI